MPNITEAELARLEELAVKSELLPMDEDDVLSVCFDGLDENRIAYIAAACDSVPRLIAKIKSLRILIGIKHAGANAAINYNDSLLSENVAQRTALIAWQFQAAGAALALQRFMDAAKNMREAQWAWEKLIGVDDDTRMQSACKLCDAEDAFDDLLAGMLKDMGTRNDPH